MTNNERPNYEERPYWNEPQDDITIIFLDKNAQREELAEIEAIERELSISLAGAK